MAKKERLTLAIGQPFRFVSIIFYFKKNSLEIQYSFKFNETAIFQDSANYGQITHERHIYKRY